jgi:FKBP-type peptidyl-prolyl cis-trans isomerase (trigger factor)
MRNGFRVSKKPTKSELGQAQNNTVQQLNEVSRKINVLDGDVDQIMSLLLSKSTDTVKKGNPVAIGFLGRLVKEDGSLEALPFPGGTTPYTLIPKFGNGQFIPGFEEQIEGMAVGSNKEISIIFPENYHAHLAGKKAIFSVVAIASWELSEAQTFIESLNVKLHEENAKNLIVQEEQKI